MLKMAIHIIFHLVKYEKYSLMLINTCNKEIRYYLCVKYTC